MSSTPFSQDHLLLHINSRKLLFHIPFHQSNAEGKPPLSSNHHDTLDPYSRQYTFDVNVIIVLSLLVCAIICSIGVNFIVKCALRCISSPDNPSAQVPNTGVEKRVLKTFTTLKYSEGVKLPGLDTECAICLSEFRNGEKVRVLPKCNHGFHLRCIDRWLGLHSTCPTCRNCLIGICQKIVPTPEIRETVLSFTPLTQESLVCHPTPQ